MAPRCARTRRRESCWICRVHPVASRCRPGAVSPPSPGPEARPASMRPIATFSIPLLAFVLASCAHRAVETTHAASAPPAHPAADRADPPEPHLPALAVDTSETLLPPGVHVKQLPEVLSRVYASYPDAAREANIQGIVQVQSLVQTDGSVSEVRVVRSVPGLDEAVMAAARQWKWKPAMTTEDKPVAVRVTVPFKFAIH